MNYREIPKLIKEVKKKLELSSLPKITVDINETGLIKSERNKNRWYKRYFNNMKAWKSFSAFFNSDNEVIYINPMYIIFGSEQHFKNLLSHELCHYKENLKKRKIKKYEDIIKNRDGILDEVRSIMVGESDDFNVEEVTEDLMNNISMMLEYQFGRVKEEMKCKSVSNELYPIKSHLKSLLGSHFFNPLFIFELSILTLISLSLLNLLQKYTCITGIKLWILFFLSYSTLYFTVLSRLRCLFTWRWGRWNIHQ